MPKRTTFLWGPRRLGSDFNQFASVDLQLTIIITWLITAVLIDDAYASAGVPFWFMVSSEGTYFEFP